MFLNPRFFLMEVLKEGGKKTSAKAKGSEGLNIQSNDSNLNQLNRKLGIVRRCAPPRAWGWRRGHGSTKGWPRAERKRPAAEGVDSPVPSPVAPSPGTMSRPPPAPPSRSREGTLALDGKPWEILFRPWGRDNDVPTNACLGRWPYFKIFRHIESFDICIKHYM
jgi:hypothetical protein